MEIKGDSHPFKCRGFHTYNQVFIQPKEKIWTKTLKKQRNLLMQWVIYVNLCHRG